MGFPSDSEVKHPLAMQQTWVRSLGWEDPLEEEMAPTSVFCQEKCQENPMDRGPRPGVAKSRT